MQRRHFLVSSATSAAALILAACGGETAATATTAKPTTIPAAPAATTSGTSASVAVPTAAVTRAAATAMTSGSAPAGTTIAAAQPTTAATVASAKPSGPADAVKVVHVPGLFFAPLYVAIEKGYFKEQNIEVSLDKAAAGSEIVAFLAQGQIDVGAVGLSAAIFNTLNKGFDFKVIASACLGPTTNSPTKFEVRKALVDGGQIKTPADLKGKKIAVAGGTGSAGAYLAVKVLQAVGLTSKDAEFVNLPNPDMVMALQNGAVDAALMGTPFSTQAIDAGVGKILTEDLAPGYATTQYVYSAKFIKERGPVATRFAAALLKGFRDIQGTGYLTDDNVKTYVKYTGSNEQTVRATPPLVYDKNMVIAKESIADQEKVHREAGWTDYKTAVDVAKLFDTTFADAAVKMLG